MSKSDKSEALARELAALFIKYKTTDWENLLSKFGSHLEDSHIAIEIRKLSSLSASSKLAPRPNRAIAAKSKKIRAGTADGSEGLARPKLSPQLLDLKDILSDKYSRPTLAALRDLYRAVGGKDMLPSARDGIVNHIMMHLSQLPEDSVRQLLSTALKPDGRPNNLRDDYQMWFDMIYTDAKPKS